MVWLPMEREVEERRRRADLVAPGERGVLGTEDLRRRFPREKVSSK
jgi:hypothetical protein